MDNRCPHHADHPLQRLQTPPGTRGCTRCHGLWLPGEVVAVALGRRPAADFDHLVERPLCCPDDGTRLRALHHEGVEIDLCTACGGIWLDGGELEAILAARQPDDGGVEFDIDAVADEVTGWFDRAGRRSGQRASDGAEAVPGAGAGSASTRSGLGKPEAPAASSTWQLERADPLPARAGGNAIDVGHAVVNTPSGSAAGAADGGLLESLGDAVGSVFGFIGDALSGL